jgi:hypothetical protein
MAGHRDRPGSRRDPSDGRRQASTAVRRRLLAICGAERTEYDYLIELTKEIGFRGLRVVPQRRGKGNDFAAGVDDAIVRARRLHADADMGPNPSSGMWTLVETIKREAMR